MTVPPARRLPGLINGGETPLENSSVVPDAAPADVPAALKGTTEGARARANSRKLSLHTHLSQMDIRIEIHNSMGRMRLRDLIHQQSRIAYTSVYRCMPR
jgi:hypothetical protein